MLSVLMYFGLRLLLYRSLDRSLVAIATAEAASATDGGASLHLHDQDLGLGGTAVTAVPHLAQILGPQGKVLISSSGQGLAQLPVSAAAVRQALAGTVAFRREELAELGEARVVYLPFRVPGEGTHILQVALPTSLVAQTLNYLLLALAVANVVTLSLMFLGGKALARCALAPVDEVTATASAISEHNLSTRLTYDGGDDEIARLVTVLNEMLDRLERAFASQQRFAANASHQLRSPLAALRGEIDVALRARRAPEEYRLVLRKVRTEADLLARLVSSLLLLSRTESGRLEGDTELVALDELGVEVAAQFSRVLADRGMNLHLEVNERVLVRGKPQLLAEIFRNLLDNALRYSRATCVWLRVEEIWGQARIAVEDNGVGIPEESVPLVVEPFYRGQGAAEVFPEGSGLGLALCQSITRAHGGELEIRRGPGGVGTAVFATLTCAGSAEKTRQRWRR